MFDQFIDKIIDEKYLIEKQLGQGGMGAVYLATHLGTKRNVALKVIMPQFTTKIEFVERFKREAEATGRLQHPNVVNVTDFGFTKLGADNIAYLVMEYLNGMALSNLLEEKGKLPLSLVVDIVEQICLALDKAHNQGIIHRDLKPDNIWLEPNGRGNFNVKILDFGLAKLRESQNIVNSIILEGNKSVDSLQAIIEKGKSFLSQDIEEDDISTSSNNLTKAGSIIGTPLYMSPEQFSGNELDIRSDLYTLGVIVYQMLTGDVPFNGNFYTLLFKHTQEMPVPVFNKNKNIPKSVSALVMSALAKNPVDRPPNAMAFAAMLRARSQTLNNIVRQSIAIYGNHLSSFLTLSLIGAIPPLIYALPYFAIYLYQGSSSNLIHFAGTTGKEFPGIQVSLITFLLLFFFGTAWRMIVSGFYAPVVSLIIMQPLSTPNLRELLQLSFKKLFFYLKTILGYMLRIGIGYLFFVLPGIRNQINYSFIPFQMVMEENNNNSPFKRSKELIKELWPTIILIQLTNIYIDFPNVSGLPNLPIAFAKSFVDVIKPATGISFTLDLIQILLMISFCILIAPLIQILLSLLYLKARQANGETMEDIFDKYQVIK